MCNFRDRGVVMRFCFLIAMMFALSTPAAAQESGNYNLGRPASAADIAAWDIDIRFDGEGLPPGEGSASDGETAYDAKCASCHGDFGQGEGRWPPLVGGFDSLTHQGDQRPEKTVGSYWPYAPTLFDYIRRAMPYTAPQSLTNEETYAIVAYILYLNDIVGDDFVADAESLAAVEMPNRDNFYIDPRPDVKNTACMKDCLDAEALQLIESLTGVTPVEHLQTAQTGEDKTDAAKPVTAQAGDGDHPGAKIYEASCMLCHAAGVAEAPLLTDTAEWQKRFDDNGGAQGLTQSVITGKGLMPPKGGAVHLSDDEIAAAVRYMLTRAKIGVK